MEHFYIYDDNPESGAVIHALSCIDHGFYSIFTQRDLQGLPSDHRHQQQVFKSMYNFLGVRKGTEWLLIVDVDEFVTSRNQPELPLSSILQDYFSKCDIISIPQIVFSPRLSNSSNNFHKLQIGSSGAAVDGSRRYRLNYRIQYDTMLRTVASNWRPTGNEGSVDSAILRTIREGSMNKVLIRTAAVNAFKGGNYAIFEDAVYGGHVCIPRLHGRMECAANLTDSVRQTYSAMLQNPATNHGFYTQTATSNYSLETGSPTSTSNSFTGSSGSLPRWCAFENSFKALQSPSRTLMLASDVDNLLLVSFQYRSNIFDDFHSQQHNTLHHRVAGRGYHHLHHSAAVAVGGVYIGDDAGVVGKSHISEVEVKLIRDEFMTSRRLPARKPSSNPVFKSAAAATVNCSCKLLGVSDSSSSTIIDRCVVDAAPEASNVARNTLPVVMNEQQTAHLQSLLRHDFSRDKYFLSIMALVRDEIDSILEFVQHYIEEGVDHFFIFDDGSRDGTTDALAACIDPKYFTIYTKKDLIGAPRGKLPQRDVYTRLYSDLGIRDKSHWLMVVDPDELMTSRTQPGKSIREFLTDTYRDCGIISAPWLVFSWGQQKDNPKNAARYMLHQRLGYGKEYAVKIKQDRYSKFHNPVDGGWQDGEWNKIIFRPALVPTFYSVHNATFGDREHGGTICVALAQPQLSCVAQCTSLPVDPVSMAIPKSHLSSRWHYTTDENWKCSIEDMPVWCRTSARYQAVTSDKCTMFQEPDIPYMDLMTFHYRVKSWEDWKRKTESKNRRGVNQYGGKTGGLEKDANRVDILDNFMSTTRWNARQQHPFFLLAQQVVRQCPATYYPTVYPTLLPPAP